MRVAHAAETVETPPATGVSPLKLLKLAKSGIRLPEAAILSASESSPLRTVYNGIVELHQWAKAHFFIGRMKDSVLAKVVEIVDRVGVSEGLEIVDVELKGGGASRFLRIYIDKPEGVTHNDCEKVSHQVGTILDEEDVIPGSLYTLEVSSPGVERKLSKPRDFERFVGQKVKVSLKEPVENQKRWEGALISFAAGVITLRTTSGNDISFSLDQVTQANLKFEW